MTPATRTWSGEAFICDRCHSTDLLNCPVCRAVTISDTVVLRELELERGKLYHIRCRFVRWRWSPAGRHFRIATDWIVGLSCIAAALALWGLAVVFFGRIILKVF